MSCATELLHPANFCPVCGARLAAPAPDGSAATTPGGITPAVTTMPADTSLENVVYLTEEHGIQPGPPHGAVPPNRRAHEYEGVEQPIQPQPAGPVPVQSNPPTPIRSRRTPVASEIEAIRQRAAEIAASLPGADQPVASHGPLPQQHELQPPPQVDDNPFGDFFSDGPSAWLEDDPEHDVVVDRRRLAGATLASAAIMMLVAGWAVWGIAMYRGAGGAEAGGFVLLSMLAWIWYLSLPRRQQHVFMLRRHAGMQRLVDRRVTPLRERTEGQLGMRRERDRYRAMRDERTRRVNALGEGAYRTFRHGQLPADLSPGAQRVLAIERQMLAQDQRIHALDQERRRGGRGGGQRGSDPAAEEPGEGHQPS